MNWLRYRGFFSLPTMIYFQLFWLKILAERSRILNSTTDRLISCFDLWQKKWKVERTTRKCLFVPFLEYRLSCCHLNRPDTSTSKRHYFLIQSLTFPHYLSCHVVCGKFAAIILNFYERVFPFACVWTLVEVFPLQLNQSFIQSLRSSMLFFWSRQINSSFCKAITLM